MIYVCSIIVASVAKPQITNLLSMLPSTPVLRTDFHSEQRLGSRCRISQPIKAVGPVDVLARYIDVQRVGKLTELWINVGLRGL